MTTTVETTTLTGLTGTYALDPSHSRVGFVARHAMIAKVRGAFNEVTGSATIDGANPAASALEVTIQPASLGTRAWTLGKARNSESYNGFHRAYQPDVLKDGE